jgi:PAS domain S-box-containing protein
MEDRYGKWHTFSSEMIDLKKSGGPVSSVSLNVGGKQIMDDLRGKRDELVRLEEGRMQMFVEHVRRTFMSLFVSTVVLVLAFGLAIATYSRRALASVARTYDDALTQARTSAEKLRQNQEWLRAVLGSIADGVVATDRHGNIIFSNAVACKILGASSDHSGPTSTHEAVRLIDEYTREDVPDLFHEVMKSHTPFTPDGHTVLLRRDGSELPVMISASPIRDQDNHVSGAVIVLRDVTVQRQSERSLQSAEKLASIGRMAATVAHEIHNPLDALGNLLYLIEHSDSLTDSNQTYIRLAREELERVTAISEQMLTFSRETRQPVEVQLSDVIENVLTLYAARIRRAGVIVVKNYTDTGTVTAFPGEMRQVFSNLVGNALDAMNGSGKLTLRIEQSHGWEETSEMGIRVMICDTGSGVPLEIRDKLMEPFVTSKGEKGTGLGLWVCRGIVEKYRGRLRYHTSTTPGRSGTCFSVFFPSAQRQAPQGSLSEQRAS